MTLEQACCDLGSTVILAHVSYRRAPGISPLPPEKRCNEGPKLDLNVHWCLNILQAA